MVEAQGNSRIPTRGHRVEVTKPSLIELGMCLRICICDQFAMLNRFKTTLAMPKKMTVLTRACLVAV